MPDRGPTPPRSPGRAMIATPPGPLAYAVAVAASLTALLISLALEPRLGERSFVLLFAAVMLSAWYGGLGPGLVATGLCGLALDYFFELPLNSFRVTSVATGLRLAVFVMVALLISSLS